MTAARNAAIHALVRRIRRETKARVPDIDPDGPGSDARVLMLLSDPGEVGALRTGYLSPMKNTDPTARNQARLMTEAGLSPDLCVFWNGIPWDLHGRKPTAADKEHGAAYLMEMLKLLPNLRAVVAAGSVAQDVCGRAGIAFIPVCHPSNRGLSGCVRGARVAREAEYRAGVARAARLASSADDGAGRLMRRGRNPDYRPPPDARQRKRDKEYIALQMSRLGDARPDLLSYPISSEELARRLLGHNREPGYGRFLQSQVRPLLRKFGCPKSGTSRQARWEVDEAMARRVASELGRPLR